jgi:pyridoxamine 5'-phosphate oxidase
VLYWEGLGRQVRLEGFVVRSPAEESDAYFATRQWRSQVNAWSSEQSQPLADPDDLERRAAGYARELGVDAAHGSPPSGRSLPRPDFWGGFRLWLECVELWAEGSDRFHERLHYSRSLATADAFAFAAGPWRVQRLQP